MFRVTRFRRPKQAAVSLPVAQQIEEPPAIALAFIDLIFKEGDQVAVVTFWVGEYEVGACFCPRLYGHPDIRY